METTESTTRSAGPKLCKENRYYYRHREEILARQKLKKMEDPEFAARQLAREQLKTEKERKAAEKEAKKEEERIKREEEKRIKDAQKQEKHRIKQEMAEEKARSIEQKRLLKATLLGAL
jgi:chromatin assembly factor 1 subunit A